MRIVYLNPSGQLGGAEHSLFQVIKAVRSAMPAWHLELVTVAEGRLTERARGLDVPTTILPFPSELARLGEHGSWRSSSATTRRLRLWGAVAAAAPSALRYANRLRRTLRDLRPDVVHSNGLKMHVLGAWARPKESALIWHVRDYVSQRPASRRLLRRYARSCDLVIANSRSVAADVTRAGIDNSKVVPLYNAVDLLEFSPAGPRLDLDALAGLPPGPPDTVRVGLIATFARWKGQKTFLEALSRLPKDLGVRGYVIGGPLYDTRNSQFTLEELRQTAIDLGVADSVGFTGFVEDAPAALRALDIVVHASTEPEPFGLVIVQAMACGRPVIVSEAGGAAEIIEPGVTAAVHPPGDVGALTQRIVELVTDRERRARLGHAAVTGAQRFDPAQMVKKLVPLYMKIATT